MDTTPEHRWNQRSFTAHMALVGGAPSLAVTHAAVGP
jgi:hypothetical protein